MGMNAARRQISADLRFNGFTGKEAYEATKKDRPAWARIQWFKGGMVIPGRPNHRPRPPKDSGLTWIGKFIRNQMMKAAAAQVKAAKAAKENYLKRKMIALEMKKNKKG